MTERLWGILVDSFPKMLLAGIRMTIPLTLISFTCAMIIAIFCAMVQYAHINVLSQIIRLYIWVFRGTPLMVQLFVIFFGLPSVGIIIDPFPCAILVFSLNEGAYCSETMRSAIESVPTGQIEAGYCCGLTYFQIMRRIVLPQAFKTAFPPLSNSLIGLVKDTSLAANITVLEMLYTTKMIVGKTYEPLALYIEVALIYLMISTILTFVQRWGEKKLGKFGY